MKKFIFVTFAFLGWAFYVMSGGQDFQPGRAQAGDQVATISTAGSAAGGGVDPTRDIALVKVDAAPALPAPEVTRASFTDPVTDISRPDEDDLAQLDPKVIAAFGSVLEDPQPQPAAFDGGLAAGVATLDLREVTGNRVNMRNGPGTQYSVVDRLTRGQEVEVLAEPGNGWLKLRVSDTGRVGWMAEFLVTAGQ